MADSPPKSPRDAYNDVAFMLLAGFQAIEFTLRKYITVVYALIKHKTRGTIPFHYSEKDLQNFTLAKLIDHFAKVNENSKLHKQLREIVKDRNHLAHEGFLLGIWNQTPDSQLEQGISALIKVQTKVNSCVQCLTEELDPLEAIIDGL